MPKEVRQKPRWALRIAELRGKLGMNQKSFSTALGTDQSNVSRWESGANRPTPDTFARMARLAPDMDKFYFLDEAGLPREFFMGGIEKVMSSELVAASGAMVMSAFSELSAGGGGTGAGPPKQGQVEMQMIPILSDAVAAGNPLTINERDIEMIVALPMAWLPKNSRVFGVRVVGNSMEPLLRDKEIAFLDVSRRDLSKLEGRMVAVRIGDGVTIKWLRHSGRFYQLVPENNSLRHEIKIMSEDDDWSIVGEVVKWIGEPPPPTARRK